MALSKAECIFKLSTFHRQSQSPWQWPENSRKSWSYLGTSRTPTLVVRAASRSSAIHVATQQDVHTEQQSLRHGSMSPWDKEVADKVVDLGGLQVPPERRAEVVEQVRAGAELGFFYVRNFGLDVELMDELRAAATNFFHLSPEEKAKAAAYVHAQVVDPGQGYATRFSAPSDSLASCRETFRVNSHPEAVRTDVFEWPPLVPQLRKTIFEYQERMSHATQFVCGLLAEGLGLPPSYITDQYGELHLKILVTHSPPHTLAPGADGEKAVPGLAPHTDSVLFNFNLAGGDGPTSKGLQFFVGGQWRTMPVFRDAVLINIGDDWETISNGKYHSALHRVLRSYEASRVSALSIVQSHSDSVVAPAAELIHPVANPARYRPRRQNDRTQQMVRAYTTGQKADVTKGFLFFHPELHLDKTKNVYMAGDQELINGMPLEYLGLTMADFS